MTDDPRTTPRSLDPRLEARIGGLRRRIRWLAFVHGAGSWIAIVALALVGSFYLDRFLDPPHAMRLVVSPLLGIGLAVAFAHLVVRPLRVKLSDADAVLLVERAHPDLRERFISALQLSREAGGASPVLVEQAVREGEEAADRLDFRRGVRPGPARRRGLAALLGLGLAVGVAAGEPDDAWVFLQRLFGATTRWPQRTQLDIDIPARSANLRVERAGDVIHVRMARGGDMAVRVVAKGIAPPIVELITNDGRRVAASLVPPEEYVTRFHAVRTPFEFHVEGGDDRDSVPRVVVETVTPPSIAKLRVAIRPPEYSAQAPFVREGGSFEAITGSHAIVQVESAAPVRRGALIVRGGDERMELKPLDAGDGAAGATHLGVEIVVEKNFRYSIELEDAEGLRNPDPGTYSVVALADRPPEIKWLAPARTDVDVSLVGSLPLQAKAVDDFGVASIALRTRVGSSGDFSETPLPLVARGGAAASEPAHAEDVRLSKIAVARKRIEIADLRANDASGERPLREGDIVEIFVEAKDSRGPKPGVGESPHVRAVVLVPGEITRRVTDRFSRAKETVQTLLSIQSDRRRRVGELIEAYGGPDASTSVERLSISSVLVGQNRVTTDGRVLLREFFESFETVAANRLDRTGEAAFNALERLRDASPVADDDPYAPSLAESVVTQLRNGSLGSPELLGKIGDMLAEAVAVATVASPGATKELDAAALATSPAAAAQALERARKHQDAVVDSLEQLLRSLAEWDNFQAVISATRSILDSQKTLLNNTKGAAKAPK